jgi:hypothetical protein
MNRQAIYAHKVMELEKARRGGKCQVNKCKSKRALEFHHFRETNLRGMGRGLVKRALDIKRNPESYILVCRKHHEKLHPEYFLSEKKKSTYRPRKFYIVYPEGFFNQGLEVTSPEKMVTTHGVTSIQITIPGGFKK